MAKFLVVDDESSNVDVITRFIEQFGHEVESAWTAETALTLIDESPFDVIVLDIMLPGMSGINCITEIKRRTKAPIIAMTGYSDNAYKEQSIKLGARAFLSKPIDFKMLELALKEALAFPDGETAEPS